MAIRRNKHTPRFRELPLERRRALISKVARLSKKETLALSGKFPFSEIESLSENVFAFFPLPLSVAENFRVNGKNYLVPMAIEEPSVVAGASFGAKLSLPKGFSASGGEGIVVGQMQVLNCVEERLLEKRGEILSLANSVDKEFVKKGGGAKFLRTRRAGKYSVLEIGFGSGNAMGANAINTICEAIAPRVEEISGGRIIGKIITNFAPERLAKASAEWDKGILYESFPDGNYSPDEIVERILALSDFAEADSARATTNNKGIMNGVSALSVATGNDWRAQEAGAHSFASIGGKYSPLAKYSRTKRGIFGEMEIPIQMGIVGAPLRNPLARVSLKILKVKSAKELSLIAASLGLAQNFAALRVLATEGIQRGHMELARRGAKNGE